MKVDESPRLPSGGSLLIIRLTDLFRSYGKALNALIERTDTETDVLSVTLTGSPFTYSVPRDGFLSITGGVGVSAAYIRQGVTTLLGSVSIVPVKAGDSVRISYTTAPTVVHI